MLRSLLVFILILTAPRAFSSVTVSVNGTNYTIPQTNERGWGTAVTSWIQAVSQYSLQPTTGTFTLAADVDFGATYGLKSAYFSSRTANPASSGLFRLANTDVLSWRNAANSANLNLAVNGSNKLTFDGVVIPTVGAGSFADNGFSIYDEGDATKTVAVSAGGAATATTSTLTFAQTANRAITFPDATTTLVGKDTTDTLTNKTFDADGTGNSISNIENDDIKAAANIARTKLANGTVDHVLINDGSGVMSSEATLAKSRGGTGQDNSSLTFPASGTITTLGANNTWTGSNEFQDSLEIGDEFYLNTANNAATGASQTLSTPATGVVRLTNGSLTSITGITAPSEFQFFVLVNATGVDVTVLNDAGTATERILTGTGSDLSFKSNASLWLAYDTVTTKWRIIGGSGGGGDPVISTQTPAGGGTVTVTANASLQTVIISGSGGAVTLSTTPFGTGSVVDGTIVELVGNHDDNTIQISYNDAADGAVGNFQNLVLTKYQTAKFRYFSSLDRWVYVQ